MVKLTGQRYLNILLALVLLCGGAAMSAELSPTSRVVGLTRPVPQGFALNIDQHILATLRENGAELTNLKTLEVVRKLGIDEPPSSAVVFSADGSLVAIGHEQGVVSVWSLDGRRVTWFKGHLDRVMALAFSPDGQWLASGGYDGTIQVWSTRTWSRIATLDGYATSEYWDYHYQAVLGLSFSADSRFLYSFETIYKNESRRFPSNRVLSSWEAGSWLETGRLSNHVEYMQSSGNSYSLDAPFTLSNWGKPQLFVEAGGGYGGPVKFVPPTLDKLRGIASDGCLPAMDDEGDIPHTDTLLTALTAHPEKGWLAAAYRLGQGTEIALIPLGGDAVQRQWPTSRQNIQLAFDDRDHLYSLSSDGNVTAWEIGPLKTLAPDKNKREEKTSPVCRPAGESPAAQKSAPAATRTLVQLAKWSLDPELKKSFLSQEGVLKRVDLVGERLTLWGWQSRVQLDAKSGAVMQRFPVSNKGDTQNNYETLVPVHGDGILYIATPDALLGIDPASGVRQTVERNPGWTLLGANVAGDYLATAWVSQTGEFSKPVEFHVRSLKSGKVRVIHPELPKVQNLTVSIMPGSAFSFLVSPDGRWLIYGLDGDVRYTTWMLLDTRTGKSERIREPLQPFEGTRLLLNDARWMGLAIFDAKTGRVETRLRRHLSRYQPDFERMPSKQAHLHGALSSGAKYGLSSAVDGSVKVWDVATGAEIASAPGTNYVMRSIGFDRQDETRFFTLQWFDGILTLWQMQEAQQ